MNRSDHRPTFVSQLANWRKRAVCGNEYVEVSKLKEWMLEGDPSNVKILLDENAPRHDPLSLDYTNLSKIYSGDKPCLLIFSILLEIDEGSLIHSLRKRDLCDLNFPMDATRVRKTFEKLSDLRSRAHSIGELSQRFYEAQWKYLPLQFELHEEKVVPDRCIVPILLQEVIKEGSSATVFEISVQDEFVDIMLQKAVSLAKYNDQDFGPAFNLVLKTYNDKDNSEELYRREMLAYKGLESNKGIVQCLFHYHRTAANTDAMTYNTVLEYGDCDLGDYMTKEPPMLEHDQLLFWSGLFQLATTIKNVHEFEYSTPSRTDTYYGWHADLSPENILLVREEFKIAASSFAMFQKQTEPMQEEIYATYNGGTIAFGAPECYPMTTGSVYHQPKVLRTTDIWSLGCIFSVAATWIVSGADGVKRFAAVRKAAIERIINERSLPEVQKAKFNTDTHGGCFHDGKSVLAEVLKWHNLLREVKRRNDRMTDQILDLVESRMLCSDTLARISAKELCDELQRIKSITEPRASAHASIMDTMLRTDEKLAKRAEAETMSHDQ